MDAWIETASGNLLNAASMNSITVKESTPGGTWEVAACTDHKTAVFASGMADRSAARTVRNTLALAASTARLAEAVQLICFDTITGTVCTEDFA